MTTGERIREARKCAGLTQEELASKLGISYQSIGQWERNIRNPKPETIQKIAKALGVTVTDLVTEDSVTNVIAQILESSPKVSDVFSMVAAQEPVVYNDKTNTIAFYFTQLNELGQDIAVERVHELTEIPRYQKDPPPEDSGNG